MKIVTVSDSPTISSGLARVHRHVIDGLLENDHQVIPCGWFAYDTDTMERIKEGGKPEPVFYESQAGKTRVLCVPKTNGMKNMFAIFDVVDMFKPDAVVTIGDPWNFFYMPAVKIKTGFSFKWIPYLTIDHDDLDEKWHPLFRYMDAIATPSKFGKEVLAKITQEEVKVIPYGIDHEVFKPVSEDRKQELKRERGCEGKTRFLLVGQNTWRKNIPALLQTLKPYRNKELRKKTTFHIHTNVDASDKQEAYLYDLKKLIQRMGLNGWVTLSNEGNHSIFENPPDKEMAEEYNASDFLVSTSTAEGFGLPLVEAMACGVPAIAHYTTTIPELLGATSLGQWSTSRGWLVNGNEMICPPARINKVVDPIDLADKINEAHRMTTTESGKEQLSKMSKSCREYAKGLTWEKMKKDLCEIVNLIKGNEIIAVEEIKGIPERNPEDRKQKKFR